MSGFRLRGFLALKYQRLLSITRWASPTDLRKDSFLKDEFDSGRCSQRTIPLLEIENPEAN